MKPQGGNMIVEIESEWRETPLACPRCGPEFTLYSDGVHWPRCVTCFYLATQADVLGCLIRPTPAELRAQYDAGEMRRALRHVRTLLATGRTVGGDWQAAALAAENFIIGMSEVTDA